MLPALTCFPFVACPNTSFPNPKPPHAPHLPEGGLAAASTDVLLLSMVVMPALAMEMVCCSMA